jgi:RNA polymerase sigma factor (sigma-70 family)
MSRSHSFPSDEVADALHAQLLADHTTAFGEFHRAFHQPLVDYLTRRFPRADPHHIESAAGQAVFDHFQHLDRFNPEKLPLRAYLSMIARRKLLRWLEKEDKHKRSREFVELGSLSGNDLSDGPPDLRLIRQEEQQAACEVFQAVERASTPSEQVVLRLWCDEERRTERFADEMGLAADLPKEEQRRQVKQVKDRLMKRLRRSGNG